MHINTFDHYQKIESLVHQLDPRTKLVVTIAVVLSNALLPDGAWQFFGGAWFFLLVCTWAARLPLLLVLKRSTLALPFALAAITVIFTLPGKPLLILNLGPWTLIASDAGWTRFLSIFLRSWLSVQAAIILTATTSFPDLIHAMRHLRAPDILVAIIAFMYRYLFVLADEALRLMRARESRSAGLPTQKRGGSLLWRAKTAGNMAGQLFLRSYERSDRVYHAMLARGYRGTLMTLHPHFMRTVDWISVCIALIWLLFLQLLAWSSKL